MILLTHIIVALFSLVYTAVVMFVPSRSRLKGSYALVALTIASGTLLIATRQVHILQTCITGLTYTGLMLVGIVVSHKRLQSTV